MVDLLVHDGIVLTMNKHREILENGAIVIDDGNIIDIGPTSEIKSSYSAEQTIDANGSAVLPGLINAHNHVSDILFRGGISSNRSLYDWILNIKFPGVKSMTPEEHEIASALFSAEAIKSGITTFVENAVGAGGGYPEPVIDAKFRAYEEAGHRVIYAQSFMDNSSGDEFSTFASRQMAKEPEIEHPSREEEITDTNTALKEMESLMEKYHESAEGRLTVWPGPVGLSTTSREGYQGSLRIAEEYDVMTTTHVSEVELHEQDHLTSVEYLNNIGYLSGRTLLGHCVHLTRRDIQLLNQTNTKVSHNPLTNLALGAGFAPIPDMINYGVTVGIGTDNSSASDTVNMVNDMRFAELIHNANHRDASSMTSEKVLEMVTIDGARAIGREDDLGSLETGKKADLFLLDLGYDHLTPHSNIPSAIVRQAQGFEVDTVICDGEVIMVDRKIDGFEEIYSDIQESAIKAANDVAQRTGITENRDWKSIADL